MNRLCYCLPIVALLLLAVPATAGEVTTIITLDGAPSGLACGAVWPENQVDLSFVEQTAEDCGGGGACSFDTGVDNVWLFPGRLSADLGERVDVVRVEIDWIDWCGTGCTRAFLYDGASTVATAGNAVGSTMETVTLVPDGGVCDRIAVSSCEGQIFEIRVTVNAVPNAVSNWGTVKSLYR